MNTVWVQEGASSLGNIVVDMIDVRQADGFVVVGTHGNGVYSTYITEFPTPVKEIAAQPKSFKLFPAYPNPFNRGTTIRFYLQKAGLAKLKVYNVLGEEIAILLDELKQAGEYQIIWTADYLSSGIYFIQLNFDNFSETQKVLLQK